ncbi:hypothetical protein HY086_00270 [Candidatus Gottesmanbacteria bacterium]|nr:hypothetical protein [Candidatus Gottesmanbacteria bacterium]
MADEETTPAEGSEESGSLLYYVIGALVVVAIAAGVWFLRPKSGMEGPSQIGTPIVPTPTPGPISALACEKQYYNPVIGFPQYYLGVDGVDVAGAKSVTCDFTVMVAGAVAASASAKAELAAAPSRNGQTFTCRTKKLELTPEVSTIVDVKLKDDLGATTPCTATTFILPKP